jgi:hypothetical protein
VLIRCFRVVNDPASAVSLDAARFGMQMLASHAGAGTGGGAGVGAGGGAGTGAVATAVSGVSTGGMRGGRHSPGAADAIGGAAPNVLLYNGCFMHMS